LNIAIFSFANLEGEQKANMHVSSLRAHLDGILPSKIKEGLCFKDKPVREPFPSGISQIDLPRATLSEVYGPTSCGKTGMVFAALARATQRPECCVLVDANDSFDPSSGSDAGIDLRQLLWIRCGKDAERALKATDLVVQSGGFGMVVLDLDGVPARDARRISLASWFRLRHAAEKANTALVVVEQELNASSCSTLHVDTRRRGFQMTGPLLRGLDAGATLGPRDRRATGFQLQPVFQK
jgi:hypothetical protein